MVKKLMLALVVAALATPSYAAVQNVKVGGSLKTTSVIRSQFSSTPARDRQNEILSQTHISVGADLTDNVSTFIDLTNERVWGEASVSNTDIDLDSAYVTMKEMLYAPLTVTVGRQPLAYGNQLIIGDGDFYSNVGTGLFTIGDLTGGVNFDAVKAILAYDPLTIDIFAARVDNTSSLGMATTKGDNVNLYGINANYKLGDDMSTVIEGYVFANMDDSDDDNTDPQQRKSTRTYVPGLRASLNPIEGLNVQLEAAYQLGSQWNSVNSSMESRSGAYAFQSMVNYALPVLKDMNAVVGASYTFLSGPKAGTSATSRRGWSSMYENQNVGRIYDIKGLASTDSQLATLSFEATPVQDVTAKLSLNGLWYAEKAAYVAGSTSSSKYLGTEVDLDLTYDYTEDVKFGVSAGHFMTGKAYVVPSNKSASQLLSSVSVLF